MAAISPTVISPNVFIECHLHDEFSEDSLCKIRKVISEQIKYNFETSNPEVRTVEIDSAPVSFSETFIIKLTAIIPNLLLLACSIYIAYKLDKQIFILDVVDDLIELAMILPISYSVASIYQAIFNTHRRSFYRVVSSPSSLNIPLEELANDKDKETGRFINHLTLEPFPENIRTPRHLIIEKRVVDLPSALFYMLTNKPEENAIPSPYHNGFLSSENKEKFLADLSKFTSISPEKLEKCWQQGVTKDEKEALIQALPQTENFQLILSDMLSRAREANLNIDEEQIKLEVLALCLKEVSLPLIRLKRLTYFLNLLPEDSKAYFPEIVQSVQRPN